MLHVAMEHANKKTWERLLGQFVGRAEGLTSRAGGRLGAEVGYTYIHTSSGGIRNIELELASESEDKKIYSSHRRGTGFGGQEHT